MLEAKLMFHLRFGHRFDCIGRPPCRTTSKFFLFCDFIEDGMPSSGVLWPLGVRRLNASASGVEQLDGRSTSARKKLVTLSQNIFVYGGIRHHQTWRCRYRSCMGLTAKFLFNLTAVIPDQYSRPYSKRKLDRFAQLSAEILLFFFFLIWFPVRVAYLQGLTIKFRQARVSSWP